jgi:ammonium transporter, Amt family
MAEEELQLWNLKYSLENIQHQINLLKESQENNTTTVSPDDTIHFVSGDTAWLLISTVLVLGMTLPGIMLYYAGMVRLGNALSTAMQGFGLTVVITFLWQCFGYSLAFAPANGDDVNAAIFGDASRFWLHGVYSSGSAHVLAPTIPESVFCSFQLAFAIITPCLICGAFADRMKYNAVLLSLGLWHLVVYCPIAHSNWHPNGFLNKAGVLDFAGGNVVHIAAGVSALVSALIVGNRTGFGKTVFQPHNLLLSLVGKSFLSLIFLTPFFLQGACSLMIGWFGFNAGSAYGANALAGYALINTQIAG